MRRRFPACVVVCTLLLSTPRLPAQAPVEIDFQRDVRPLLSNHCFKCHGPAAQEGGLRLDERERAVRRAIVPGSPHKSKVMERLLAEDDERMPPPEAGDRLKPAEVEILKKWIAAGAEYKPHWAFQKPIQAALPTLKDGRTPHNPIDAFIRARLEKEGLTPSPEADRPTQIRRLALDLLGVLPSPKEVDEYVNDRSPDAYEKLVDRLLASPHYGERQARHWLDLARYADSNGYTIDGKRSIWPYRDWVIGAFNRDLPFDRFTIEQLAGDLLPNPTRDQLVATGFHRNTSFNEEGGTSPEQFRVERVVDRTNTTGTVWLGLTVGCCQCHDHKYDPVSQKEYFQLYAFFNSTDEPKLPLPTAEQQKRLAALNAELIKVKAPAPPQKKSLKEVESLLADLEKETNGGWRIIYPKAVTAERGATLTVMDDRSVLAGKSEESETYTVQSVAPETGVVTAVRLEALTHDSLPAKGPGRAGNGNFVLSDLDFETDGVPRKFRRAVADHSQKNYDVSEVLKADTKKGWAVNADNPKERNVDRTAVFFLEKPYQVREGQAFTFTLRFSQTPKAYNLGRFRLAVTFASDRVLDLPLAAQKIVLMDRAQRSSKDMEALQMALATAPTGSVKVAEIQKQIKAAEDAVDSTLILRETAKARPTHIQKRGDFLDLGDAVEANGFAILPPLPVKGRPANRLDLATWLVSPDHPLTGRVVVNRVWQQYFGKGLVDTENDFGMQGALPTHPELLDWLAVEFVKQGWSMKKLHRLIATSQTYRQASAVRPDVQAKDPQNRLLARQHRLRLEAEIIRDAALSASGLLTRTVGGPGVYPPQPPEIFAFTQSKHPWPESKGPDRYRRGMYTFIWRQSQHPLLTTFDAPDAQAACTRRNRSNTPLQALHLANDPTFLEIAAGLARRVETEGPPDDAGRVAYAFKLCYARTPTPAERDRLVAYVGQQRQASADLAWTMVARVLLNLDEFITRE